MFKVASVPTTLRKLPFLPLFVGSAKEIKITLPTQQKGDKNDFGDPTKMG